MLAAGGEFFTAQAQTVNKDIYHQGVLLLTSVVGAGLEEQALRLALNCPCAHGQTELNIGLDLAGVEGAVEEPELHCSLGEKGVKVDAVVAGCVVVVVINASSISVIGLTVPYAFHCGLGFTGCLHGL